MARTEHLQEAPLAVEYLWFSSLLAFVFCTRNSILLFARSSSFASCWPAFIPQHDLSPILHAYQTRTRACNVASVHLGGDAVSQLRMRLRQIELAVSLSSAVVCLDLQKWRILRPALSLRLLWLLIAPAQAAKFVKGMYGKDKAESSSYATGTGDDGKCDTSIPSAPVAVDTIFWNILAGADPEADRKKAHARTHGRARTYTHARARANAPSCVGRRP
eukprot:6204455-Pleurochrysis_carterae.AAC.4